jgi:hypothetical protein
MALANNVQHSMAGSGKKYIHCNELAMHILGKSNDLGLCMQ